MLNKSQDQQVSSGGIAAQGGRDVNIEVTNVGLNYLEVKEVAKDVALNVFRENFPKLQGEAMKLASARGEAITEDFFLKLQKENPDGLYQANSPDFQDALFTVQKEHAKAGDEDLGSLLVDLLVDRTKETSRSTLQIVLNESLHVAPKLTSMHLAVLAVVFFFRYTRNPDIGNFNLLAQYLSNHMETFSDLLPKNEGAFQHLQFTGCGSTSMGSISLENIFRLNFGGLFNKGFEENRLLELPITLLGSNRNFFVPCINDLSKLQVRSVDLDSLKNHLIVNSVSNEDQQKMEQLFQENMMSDNEIKEKIVSESPFMESIFSAWSSTKLQNFELTSVGIAIGHANIKRLKGEFSNLSIWIN